MIMYTEKKELSIVEAQYKYNRLNSYFYAWELLPPLNNDLGIKLAVQLLNVIAVIDGNCLWICLKSFNVFGHVLFAHSRV